MKVTHNSKGWYAINLDSQEMNNKMVRYSSDHMQDGEEERSIGQGGGGIIS